MVKPPAVPAIVVPEVPAGPPLQQDIHCVLKVEVRLRRQPYPDTNASDTPPAGIALSPAPQPATGSKPQPAAAADVFTSHTSPAAEASSSQGEAPAPEVDPRTLHLLLRFMPWADEEVVLAPVPLTFTPDGAAAAAAAGFSTAPPPPLVARPPPAAAPTSPTKGGKAGKPSPAAPAPSPAAAAAAAAAAPPQAGLEFQRWWQAEHHWKLAADETRVRAMAGGHGLLPLHLTLTQPQPEPPPKAAKGQAAAAPPPPVAAYSSVLTLACAGLLVGDTGATATWPAKLQPLAPELAQLCESVTVSLQTLAMPEKTPEQLAAEAALAAAAAKPSKPGSGKGKAGARGAALKEVVVPEPDLASHRGALLALLTPALAARLNPVVVMPLRAHLLPDAPARTELLDTKCAPVKLRVCWPPQAEPREQAGRAGPWSTRQAAEGGGAGLATRSVGFGLPDVFLAGECPADQVLGWCREQPLLLEVHDRTALPDPPDLTLIRAAASGQEGGPPPPGPQDEGYVCAVARISLLDLARGATRTAFCAPLAPHTTVRGAASLDWTTRPGCYAASGAVLKGWVRCAVPFAAQAGVPPAARCFTRSVFVMDYRDSALFHTLEDSVRRQNAVALGLANLPQPTSRPASPAPQPLLAPEDLPELPQPLSAAGGGGRGGATGGAAQGASAAKVQAMGPKAAPPAAAPAAPAAPPTPPLQLPSITQSNGQAAQPSGPFPSGHRGSQAAPGGLQQQLIGGRYVLCSASTLNSVALQQGPRPDKKELRFHDFGDIEEHSDSASSPDGPASALTAADEALEGVLQGLEAVTLDMRLNQALSTYKLSEEQAADPDLDLLTGFHLVDGRRRLIVLEGLASGAMKLVAGIADWALSEVQVEEGWLPRRVLASSAVRYPCRLWGSLGVDLHIVKLRSHLNKLIAEAASYATGSVRVDCIAGLRRLGDLEKAPWARLADALALFPTPHMVHLVDKKFGGELTKADVFGVEVDEFESDAEDGGHLGLVKEDDMRSSISSKRSARSKSKSQRTRKSCGRKSSRSKYARRHPTLLPLDRFNAAYLVMRQEARMRRLATDWHTHHLAHLRSLEATCSHIRESWATWNPQREAARQLEAALRAGTVSLQDLQLLQTRRQAAEAVPGTLSREEAAARGWAPHPGVFKWPAPKEPGSYAHHPRAPSQFRVEQLAEPWDEAGAGLAPASCPAAPSPGFVTTVKSPREGLFGGDLSYWKTVHSTGSERQKEERERLAAEKAEWRRKLVGEPVLHLALPQHSRPVQIDRMKHILHDEPVKKGFAIAHVPPAPYSVLATEPWKEEPGPLAMTGALAADTTKFTAPGQDFRRYIAKERRAVSIPGPRHMQSWTAALHDPYNQDS
ncbi:hypothetical protein V8C86DRAFT_2518926 [Haematococcus lacustris]